MPPLCVCAPAGATHCVYTCVESTLYVCVCACRGHSEIHESSSRRVLLTAEQGAASDHDQYLSSSAGDSGSSLALKRLPPAKGFIEAIYTFWYKGAFRFLFTAHATVSRVQNWPFCLSLKVEPMSTSITGIAGHRPMSVGVTQRQTSHGDHCV